MTNAQALRAVTTRAAAACWVADRKASLACGHYADLVAVKGDPVTHVSALLRVTAVFRSGVRVR